MPDRKSIFDYWYSNSDFIKNRIDSQWFFLHKLNPLDYSDKLSIFEKKREVTPCFACGFDFSIERCHIVPVSKGGSHDCSNIHLLCKNCHAESESLTGNSYFDWMRSKDIVAYQKIYYEQYVSKMNFVKEFIKKNDIVCDIYNKLKKENWEQAIAFATFCYKNYNS